MDDHEEPSVHRKRLIVHLAPTVSSVLTNFELKSQTNWNKNVAKHELKTLSDLQEKSHQCVAEFTNKFEPESVRVQAKTWPSLR